MATKILEAKKILEQYAPAGEFLAYINKEEAEILKSLGASGTPVEETGIPSFQLPDYLQDTAKDYAKQATGTYSVPIDTSKFTGQQFVAGEDPNYGRIIMAIGKSEENIIVNNLTIKFGKFTVVENGQQIDNYNEKIVKEYMKWDAIEINIELNMGKSNFTVYTCDFTKDYIDINTDYRN